MVYGKLEQLWQIPAKQNCGQLSSLWNNHKTPLWCGPVSEDAGYTKSRFMMTSSSGNIFRVTGPLCGEFTGPGEFPAQRPVTRGFDVFFDLHLNKRLSKQSWDWWFETLSWSLWRHCNVEQKWDREFTKTAGDSQCELLLWAHVCIHMQSDLVKARSVDMIHSILYTAHSHCKGRIYRTLTGFELTKGNLCIALMGELWDPIVSSLRRIDHVTTDHPFGVKVWQRFLWFATNIFLSWVCAQSTLVIQLYSARNVKTSSQLK